MLISSELLNVLLLVLQGFIYFGVMTALFRARTRIGIGVFMCALGVMHFLETYLASVFYIQLPFGIISPGSTVLFSGKLLMILMLYIKEDASMVRQPIYGLLIGNFLIVGLVVVLRNHEIVPAVQGRESDIAFVDEMGWLMVWGTILLFIDAIGIILLYERLGAWLRHRLFVRMLLSSAALLTFDQLGFSFALHYVSGAPFNVLFGGWVAKMAAAVFYSGLVAVYLSRFERQDQEGVALPLSDIFGTLTYRERYHALLERTGRDALTGVLDRGQLEEIGRKKVLEALSGSEAVSLLAIDIDDFKTANDRHGHAYGDAILRQVADLLTASLREGDQLFRYGGDEFVVLCQAQPHASALQLAGRLRRTIADASITVHQAPVTVSIGVATSATDGLDLNALFEAADTRLYVAKQMGRNRVVGQNGAVESIAG